jgi:hypothetical protein
MLRDEYAYGTVTLREILRQFCVPNDKVLIDIFMTIDPDAFIWRLFLEDGTYYLYAEDLTDTTRAKAAIEKTHGSPASGHFVLLRSVTSRRSHNIIAHTNGKPIYDDPDMRDVAIRSGYDWVFLYKLDDGDA